MKSRIAHVQVQVDNEARIISDSPTARRVPLRAVG
jgi:hypothetical protein